MAGAVFEQTETPQVEIPVAELRAVAQAHGFQSGREEGLAQGLAEAKEIVHRMAAVADELAQPFRGLDAQVTRELARMAMLLAQQIVHANWPSIQPWWRISLPRRCRLCTSLTVSW